MNAKENNIANGQIESKAKEPLQFAEQRAAEVTDWTEPHNDLFGIHGKASEMFVTESERRAFTKTNECKRIYALFDKLPRLQESAR